MLSGCTRGVAWLPFFGRAVTCGTGTVMNHCSMALPFVSQNALGTTSSNLTAPSGALPQFKAPPRQFYLVVLDCQNHYVCKQICVLYVLALNIAPGW